MASGKILIIRGGAVGDFIVTLPVFAALRKQFPSTQLEVVGYPAVTSLALQSGLVDAMRPIEARPLASFFARRGELDPAWSEYFAGFHVIFTYLFDPDEFFRTNLAKVTKAQVIQGPHRPEEPSATHVTAQLLAPLQRFAIFDADPVPRLGTSVGGIGGDAPAGSLPRIAVHPGAGGRHKLWPVSHWSALLESILERHAVRLLVVGGEADQEVVQPLLQRLPSDRVDLMMNRPLTEVAEALKRCCGFVGHDSGITHLAAACGVPGLVLWGPTDAEVWAPNAAWMPRIQAEGGELSCLPVRAVAAELDRRIPSWLTATSSSNPQPEPGGG